MTVPFYIISKNGILAVFYFHIFVSSAKIAFGSMLNLIIITILCVLYNISEKNGVILFKFGTAIET